jgi:hypothetical protein
MMRVSCIMPTANRRDFVPRAVRCFLQQDYTDRELIVLDDGSDSVADLMPPDDRRVVYIRLAQRLPLGTKRNRCIAASHGELIMHWDDDDWHAPHRISLQVRQLEAHQAEVCGLRKLLFHEIATGAVYLYEYSQNVRPWLVGGSLLYTREFWSRSPFLAVDVGEDNRFLFNRPSLRLANVDDLTCYVATIHPGNTSPRNTRGAYWSRWSGALPYSTDEQRPGGSHGMKLNLGCCDAPLTGFTNVDAVPGPGVEVTDLRQAWPWPDESVEHVRAWDIIEHLPDKIHTMNELWRVLAATGTAEIAVPTTDGPGAFQDPTHVSFWNRRSFLYYEDGNPYRERFARQYGIAARFRVLSERVDRSLDGPRLTIMLQAIKA